MANAIVHGTSQPGTFAQYGQFFALSSAGGKRRMGLAQLRECGPKLFAL
jgi:hypothetical protein